MTNDDRFPADGATLLLERAEPGERERIGNGAKWAAARCRARIENGTATEDDYATYVQAMLQLAGLDDRWRARPAPADEPERLLA